MFNKHPKMFQDPQIEYPIYDLNLDFADYITKSKKIITDYRVDLNKGADLIINANTPFELRPEHPQFSVKDPHKIKYGALLVHGLLDTPFIMKDIGKHLQSQGLLVRSIILPGHATVPGSLLNVKYEDWLQAVRYGIASLSKDVEAIFLVGFSTGASLNLLHTLQNPSQIAGMIMLAPAYKINSSFDFLTNWHHAISWKWPRAQWLYISEEMDYTKYCSIAFNAVYQVYRLTQAIKKIDHTREPPCPLFMVLSYDDLIVNSEASIRNFQGYTHPHNKMILYIHDLHKFNDSRIISRKAAYPEWNITSFSHISLPSSPDNPHYGKHGDYPLASHIDAKNHYLFCSLDKPQKLFFDLLYKLKLTRYQRQRLTFNPDFEFLVDALSQFIKKSATKNEVISTNINPSVNHLVD